MYLCKMFSCFVNGNILISLSVLFMLATFIVYCMIHRKIITGKNDENAVNNSFPSKLKSKQASKHYIDFFSSHLTTWWRRRQCMIFNVAINCVNDSIPFNSIHMRTKKMSFEIDVSPHTEWTFKIQWTPFL